MARYQVILTYDGTEFFGFQRQAGARTVQCVVEEALRRLNWQGYSLLAAGRTDTGVHATGQVIAFDLEWQHSPEDLRRAMNAYLPLDVAVRDVIVASEEFHPRYAAYSRSYRYHIFSQEVRDPIRERYAWRVWPPVDIDRLNAAAGYLLGRHDFAAFGSPPKLGGSTQRTVYQAGWRYKRSDSEDPPGLVFEISAQAYLYHMVRRLVSIQVEIGQKRLDPAEINRFFEKDSLPVQGLAPAHGLFLSEVRYPSSPVDGGGEEDTASLED